MKGTPLTLLFAHIFLRKDSPDPGRCAQAHCGYAPLNIISPASTIAAQLAIGTGVALATRCKEGERGGGTLGRRFYQSGPWDESLNFAGVHHLPIVFVLENNLWAESVPARLQSAVDDFSIKAQAYGVRGITVDRNDVVAVYRASQDAIRRAVGAIGAQGTASTAIHLTDRFLEVFAAWRTAEGNSLPDASERSLLAGVRQ